MGLRIITILNPKPNLTTQLCGENPEVVVPKPTTYTEDALPKRENDPVSGDMPFAEKKNGNRIYKVGNRWIQVPKNVISKLKSWMTFLVICHTKYDRKMVEMLLILTVGLENVRLEHNSQIFILSKGFLGIRAGNDSVQDDYLDKYSREHSE